MEETENTALKKLYQGRQVLGTMGYALAEDPTTVLSPGKGLGGAIGKTSKAMKPAGVPMEILNPKGGFPLTPAQAKGKTSYVK